VIRAAVYLATRI